MATFRRNRSGHWEAAVRRRNHPPQYATFDTEADAEAWAASIEGDMARGPFVSGAEAEKTSLAEALDRYEREVSAKKRGYAQERYRIAWFRRHPMAQRSLASIRSKDIADYIGKSERVGVLAQTIRLEHPDRNRRQRERR